MAWNQERTETAVKMWGEGHSAASIALEIGGGLSRNAVIGKVHRLGLVSRKTVSFVNTSSGLARSATPKPRHGNKTSASFLARSHLRLKTAPIPDPVAPTLEHKVGFFDLDNQHCRYPLWTAETPIRDTFYCGNPLADLVAGRPYCPFHQARMWRKREAA